MKSSLSISGLLFLVYLGLVSLQGDSEPYMVDFRTPGMPTLDIESANLLDELNRFQLKNVSPHENVVAGLYELAMVDELRFATTTHVKTLERALGVKIQMDPATSISNGQRKSWQDNPTSLGHRGPILRRYFARHKVALDQIGTIFDRRHYANYYYSESPILFHSLFPMVRNARNYCRILILRARVALADDRVGDAISDLTAVSQLSRHLVSSNSTIESFLGSSLSQISMSTWCKILSHPDLTRDHLEGISSVLKPIPPPTRTKAYDLDRLATHQVASYMEEYGQTGFQRITESNIDSPLLLVLLPFVDWQEIHRRIDENVNACLDILLISDDLERRTKYSEVIARSENRFSTSSTFNYMNIPALATDLAWMAIDDVSASSVRDTLDSYDWRPFGSDLAETCIALKRFHLENQRYPATLDELLGKYLDHIPLDSATGEPVHYLSFKNGAMVYTVGRSGFDNGGRGPDLGGDDNVFLLGHDERPVPDGYQRPLPVAPGRRIRNISDHYWPGKRLSLAGEQISREEFSAVCDLTPLEWLDLGAAELPEKWHEEIPRLQNLRTLSLTGIELTRETLEQVARLPVLQTLVLNDTDVTGILQPLANIPRLETLYLSGSSVTDDDLAALTGLLTLKRLTLNETNITDAVAPLLGKLTGLTELHLSGTGITDAGLAHISELPDLLTLRLDFTGVTNAGIALLKTENLAVLGLNGTSVNNGAVESLVRFQQLSAVYLYETSFTAEGRDQFLQGWERWNGNLPSLETISRYIRLEFTDTGTNAAQPAEPEPGSIIDGPHERPARKYNQRQIDGWGTLTGTSGSYTILQDDKKLKIQLAVPSNTQSSRSRPESVSVTRPITGDFDVRVKVIPDWERHDQIMVGEAAGSPGFRGVPYLGAGLLVEQSPTHYLRWCWNSIGLSTGDNYSRITPEYFVYANRQGGALADFAFNLNNWDHGYKGRYQTAEEWLASGFLSEWLDPYDPADGMIVPQPAIEGSPRYFDSESFSFRLQRRGDTLTSFWSTDGKTWKSTSRRRVRFGDEVRVGVWCGKLAMTEYGFTFEDFQVSP
jgi:hypothetical protein